MGGVHDSVRLTSIVIIILLTTNSWAVPPLTQSLVEGTASSSANPSSLSTTAGGFVSNTVANSLIIGIVYGTQAASTGNFGAGLSIGCAIDNTHGFTFSAAGGLQWEGGPGGAKVRQGIICIKFMTAAASIPNTATTFAKCNYQAGTGNWSGTCELHLYEFAINSTADGGLVDQSQTVGTPLAASSKTTTNATDLILAYYSSDTATASYATAGSGYTLGLATTVAGIGQLQWQYVTSAGAYSLSFAGAASNDGVGQALAFKQIAPPAGVLRHRGSVF